MRRPLVLVLIALGILLFFAVSALLARVLSVGSAEQAAITTLVQAEARGQTAEMIRLIDGCSRSASCRQRVSQNARQLARPGAVTILELGSSAGFSLGSTTGTSRVAWRAGNGLPVVQCVRVRRAGNVLSGLHVELLKLSLRIKSSADCPARY